MKNTTIFLTAFLLLLLTFQSCTKDEPISDATEFREYLEDEMDDQNIPALSVLLFKENQILQETYLGQSQVQQNIELQADHLFLLASVSKMVTATALMQWYDKGSFGLDDPINNYLSFNVTSPFHNTPITFRMLLTHTSGIADGAALDQQYYDNMDSPVALADFLEDYLVPGGQYYDASDNFESFEPGTKHEYSNTGNALIAVLVEQLSGMGFNDYCKANIFAPLGMTNTFWRLDEITGTIVQPYDYSNGQYQAIAHYTFTDYPNGGLRSTSKDLFKFLRAFALGGQSNNYQLLKATTVDAMLTPQIPTLDPQVGLHIFRLSDTYTLWGHDGGEKGVATIMAFNPTTKVGAIILTNQGEADLDNMLEESYQFALEL